MSWDKTKPSDTGIVRSEVSDIRDNWDYIEDKLSDALDVITSWSKTDKNETPNQKPGNYRNW